MADRKSNSQLEISEGRAELRSALEWVDVRACPLCGSPTEDHEHFESWREELELQYRICRRCGLVFQSPRPSRSSLDTYYRELYHRHRAPGAEDVARNRWVQRRRAEHLIRVLIENGITAQRALDIGSSRGSLLGAMRDAWGSEVYGVEPGEEHRAWANDHGIRTAASLDELDSELRGRFDLVSLSHVLEHMPDPVHALADIRRKWLSSDGHIVVEVPNLFWHPAFELAHTTSFSLSTLLKAMARAGFELSASRIHGKPYSRLLPLFVLAIGQPGSGRRERRSGVWVPAVKLRRRLGRLITRSARALGARILRREDLSPWHGGA